MASIKTVALSGASGNIGAPILQALLNANFDVTVLTRQNSSASFPNSVKVARVDYDDVESLESAMKGHDAVVSAVGYGGTLAQEKLIDAAIAAGVKRIIPSEFGSDPDCIRARALPVFGHKAQVEKHLKKKVQGTSTTYSLICNNELFDWCLDHKFGVDIKGKKMEIFDGGDTPFTAAPLSFVAKGVSTILQHPAETANRVVRFYGMTMTQNKLLGLLQRYTGDESWQTPHISLVDREREGYEMLQRDPSNFVPWAVAFLHCAVYGKDFGVNLENHNDNELLGLKTLSETEIEEVVKARC